MLGAPPGEAAENTGGDTATKEAGSRLYALPSRMNAVVPVVMMMILVAQIQYDEENGSNNTSMTGLTARLAHFPTLTVWGDLFLTDSFTPGPSALMLGLKAADPPFRRHEGRSSCGRSGAQCPALLRGGTGTEHLNLRDTNTPYARHHALGTPVLQSS